MSNRIPYLVSALVLACGIAQNAPDNCKFPDGSNSCDSGPVLARQLGGLWCEDTVTGLSSDSNSECLLVEAREQIEGDPRSVRMHYTRYSYFFDEEGWLSGGLEFSPVSNSCTQPLDMYAASVDWTETGIAVFYDDRPVVHFTINDQGVSSLPAIVHVQHFAYMGE